MSDRVLKFEDAVLGVEAKRRRVEASPDDEYLETEEDVPEGDLEEFEDRMECLAVERGSADWKRYWREHAELRLQDSDPEAFAAYERRKAARARGVDPAAEDPSGGVEVDFDDDWDGWVDLEDGDEEARVARMCRPCDPPDVETIRQHNIGHCNYRGWCPVCVAGAANDRAHVARGEEGQVPEIHSEYCFCRNRRGDRLYRPVLVTKTRGKRAFSAHAVPKNGTGGGWIVQQLLRDLKKWGLRSDLILRSDGEPALLDLLDKVSNLRGKNTMIETSPVGDSRSNGLAERAVQSVQKHV